MSDVQVDTQAQDEQSIAPIPFAPPPRRRRWRRDRSGRPAKPRLRKLRLLGILVALGTLAFISAVFGMMMAVASDLPQITNVTQQRQQVNSYLYDDEGRPIGIFASPTNTVIDSWKQISQSMVHAIVAVEDKRFWSDPGVDLKGVVRAFVSDVSGGQTEGGSTITEQFIKQVLGEENNRTILEKLREAALAWQLTRRWKPMKILTQYLNTVYFGHGAYGIESAARVYFGAAHGYDANAGPDQPDGACGAATPGDTTRPTCASELRPWESALLAGMIANPTAFDPFNPATRQNAWLRRKQVLLDMYQQGYIKTYAQFKQYVNEPLPSDAGLQQPSEPPAAPYFTSWLRPQVIHAIERADHVPQRIAEYRAFYGGLKIKTTIDLSLQQAAQQAIDAEFPPGTGGPTAALVAIDNQTGEVRAMVSGGGDWNQSQFNLAANSERQPGSAFKVFTLAEALATGEYGPDSVIDSAPQNILFKAPHIKPLQHFIVHNFGNTYSGPITLQEATDISDNSVFAQVGMHIGTQKIKHIAQEMGIRTPISTNPAMIIGGLHTGVSPLDMAHAYETLAMNGVKVYNNTLGDFGQGPIGIHSITCTTNICGHKNQTITNHPTYRRVLPATVAETEKSMLEGVVSQGGTAPQAAIPGTIVWGKTGTTSNYVDAWFVGSTAQMTTAVWVGYPNSAVPMLTNYNGAPVEGGTFPAIIWNDFMTQALQILANEAAAQHQGTGATGTSGSATGVPANPTGTATAPSTVTPSTGATGTGTGNGGNTGTGNGGNTGTGTGGNTGTGNGGNTGTGTGNGGNTGTGTGNGGNTGTGTGGNTGTGTGSGGTSPGGSGGAGLGGGGGGPSNGPASGTGTGTG
jgi:penicillin-binding protein 1A